MQFARQALTISEKMVTNKQNFLLNLSMICDMALNWQAEWKGHLLHMMSSAHTNQCYGSDSSLFLSTRSYDHTAVGDVERKMNSAPLLVRSMQWCQLNALCG